MKHPEDRILAAFTIIAAAVVIAVLYRAAMAIRIGDTP